MKTILANNKNLKTQYLEFMQAIYKGNNNYKNLNAVFAKNFLFKEDLFSNKCTVLPILIIENDRILACATCIIHPMAQELYLSFFEAFPNQEEAVALIVSYARKKAKELNKTKIIVGINGHISYSVGMLANNHDQPQSFDSTYNPNYYTDYFNKYYTARKEAVSYACDLDEIRFDTKVLTRLYGTISFRMMDKRNYKKEIMIFGDLCHKVFEGTPFYCEKTKEETYDSLKPMRYIFNKENLVFALKDGVEVGFLLMHPDYNQIIQGQKLTPFKLLLGNVFKGKNIDTMIMNAVGVLPEYQNSGIIIGLFNEAYKIIRNRYKKAISTFIMKDNVKSLSVFGKFASNEINKYYIYEIGAKGK